MLPEQLLSSISTAQEEIDGFLREDSLSAGSVIPSEISRIPALLASIEEVGTHLHPEHGAPASRELSNYTENLRTLRDALQHTNHRLLEARANLVRERDRLDSVGRWMAAARTTQPTPETNFALK